MLAAWVSAGGDVSKTKGYLPTGEKGASRQGLYLTLTHGVVWHLPGEERWCLTAAVPESRFDVLRRWVRGGMLEAAAF